MFLAPGLKLFWYGDRVKKWLEGKRVAPILVEIDPTGYCDANCPWCFYGSFKEPINIDTKVLLKTLKELAKIGVKAINWTGGGEPTLHPNFVLFTKAVKDLGLKQGIFTNALSEKHKVVPEHFEWIRISTTDRYLNSSSKALAKFYAKKVKTGVVYNLTEENMDYVAKYCKEMKALGIHYFQVRPALTQKWEDQQRVPLPMELMDFEDKNFKVYLTKYKFEDYMSPKEYKECYGAHLCPVIDYRGDIRWCNYFLFDKEHKLGNIRQGFKKVWSKFPDSMKVQPDCQNCCKNHEINKIMAKAKQITDKEFI